jgi:hypothetical protein
LLSTVDFGVALPAATGNVMALIIEGMVHLADSGEAGLETTDNLTWYIA